MFILTLIQTAYDDVRDIFSKYRSMMKNLAYSILKDYQLSENAVQEALIRLSANVDKIDYLNQFERTKLNWADSFNTEVDGYFIKPVRYRAISDDIFAEPPVMNIELRSFYLKELVETEGKELVDEIRNWCIENSDKESACFCYKKGRDCWILYYDKNAEPRCAWYEPTLTYERDLKVYIKNTYWELKNVPKGIWCLEKISLPVPVNKIEAHLYIGGGHYERVEIDRIEKAATD